MVNFVSLQPPMKGEVTGRANRLAILLNYHKIIIIIIIILLLIIIIMFILDVIYNYHVVED